MKNITMDFETYEKELEQARLGGVGIGKELPDKIIKIVDNLDRNVHTRQEFSANLYELRCIAAAIRTVHAPDRNNK